MKLSLQTQPLLDALDYASLALAPRMNLPVLTCALIECDHSSQCTVTCDSLDARMTVRFDGVKTDEPFSFLVSPRMLRASLRESEAEIEIGKNALTIRSGGVSKLALCFDKYPEPWKAIACKPIEGAAFLSALRVTGNCADSSPTSNQDFVAWSREHGRMYATNGKALIGSDVALDLANSFMLPLAHAKLILSAFDHEDEITLGMDVGTMCLESDDRRLWVKLREGEVPDFQRYFPKMKPLASIGREAFQEALATIGDFAEKEWQKIYVTLGKSWELRANDGNNESTVTLSDVKEKSNGVPQIAFARQYLANIIKFWTCDRISVATDGSVLTLTPEDKTGHVGVQSLMRV
jgi:DNA polymerase III sliding clamp (beta) subunit (PCNA family)